jgi:alkylation response protein AidB-like acyl-CoA dehydrogenase
MNTYLRNRRLITACSVLGLAVMNLHGAEGYVRQHPWERYMRDPLGLIGGQGAQELLLVQLGQQAAFEMKRSTNTTRPPVG